jgi:PEP-CTERM motif
MKSLLQARSDKPAVNFVSRFASAVALMLIASAPAAVAQIYTFSFAGNDGIDATGTITISGGVATSGSINVVNVPLESLPGTTTASGNLLPLSAGSPIPGSQSNVRTQDGTVITYDVAAFAPPSDPIFDGTGVCFGSGYAGLQSSTPSYDTLVNIWSNGPGSYGMFIGEANPAYLNPDGTPIAGAPHNEIQWVYVYNEPGTLTLTPVPEPATLGLLSAGLLGLLALRRRKA